MAKARVATRVKAAVGGQKSLNTSQDLVQLTERYNVFCKRLQGLIAALKAHFQSMQSVAKTRYSVRKNHVQVPSDTAPANSRQVQVYPCVHHRSPSLSFPVAGGTTLGGDVERHSLI